MSVDLATFTQTRLGLQAIAEHVMSAARHAATGRIGLQVSPGGFATPAFPSDSGERTLAVEWTDFVVRDDRGEQRAPITTVGAAAGLAGITPGAPTDLFTPTTSLAPDEPLPIDAAAAAEVADWYGLGDAALAAFRSQVAHPDATEIQLWPEHFDVGFQAVEVNWGASPGDHHVGEPYLYVQPWSFSGPVGTYWNIDFGAVVTRDQISSVDDAVHFFLAGDKLA